MSQGRAAFERGDITSLFIPIEQPVFNMRYVLVQAPMPITIARIGSAQEGGVVSWSLSHGADPTGAGTSIRSTTIGVSTSVVYVVPDGATLVPTNDYIWTDITATLFDPTQNNLTLEFS